MTAKVSLQRCVSYDPAAVRAGIVAALGPFGGMSAFVRPGNRVLLKPNYVMARPAERGANTHPVFIAEVARLVLECGGEPFVADSPGWGTAQSVAHANGLGDAARGMDLPVRTLRKSEWRATRGSAVAGIRVAREVLDADVVINLPKFKAHQQMLLTLAVKNLFGCLPGRRKAWLHMVSKDDPHWFGRMLVENYLAVNPALAIMDGIVAMEGRGPANGDPRPMNLVMAAVDHVAMDRVAAELVGVPWRQVFTLAAAEAMKVGETEIDRIEVVGARIAELRQPDFSLPRLVGISFSPWRVARGWLRNLLLQMKSPAAGNPSS
jgi:uncharacterized protein (DUF362 family)